MRAGWLAAALLLLAGCNGIGVLRTFVTQSQPPAGIAGRYQVHTAGSTEGWPAEEAEGVTCIKVGRAPAPRSYCRFDKAEDRGDIPRFIDIVQSDGVLTFRDPERPAFGEDATVPELRFLPLADTVYLVQSREGDEGKFAYFVVRVGDGWLELFNPDCDHFRKSTERTTHQYGITCTASSLAAIRPELDAFVAPILAEAIDIPMPMALLKRL